MSWPSDPNYSALAKTDMDAGGDVPANARLQLELLLDRVNAAQALLEQIIENGRPLTLGGAETLTALFTLSGDGTAPLHPVSKQQFDGSAVGFKVVPNGGTGSASSASGALIELYNVTNIDWTQYDAPFGGSLISLAGSTAGAFTAPTAGLYLFTVAGYFNGSVNSINGKLRMMVNHTTPHQSSQPKFMSVPTSGVNLFCDFTFLVSLAAGDVATIALDATGPGGSWTLTFSPREYFGVKIR